MSAAAWASWLDRLEGARSQEQVLATKVRAGNTLAIGASAFALQQTVARLKRDFDQLRETSATLVTPQEMARREALMDQLLRDQKSDMDTYNNRRTTGGGGRGAPDHSAHQLLSMQNQIMKDQDQQLDDIGKGVANLKNFSLSVKDETEYHVRLLDDMDEDVSKATGGLETEGAHAKQVARNSSNFKLYMIILVLFVILIFLLVIGGGR